MSLENFRMLIHELLNKDPDIFPEEYTLIFLDSKSAMCMDKNGKDIKLSLSMLLDRGRTVALVLSRHPWRLQ